MANGNNTSIKPADNSTLTGILKTIQNITSRNIENMLPARVINFDRSTNRVTVQPLIRVVGTNGKVIGRERVASMPVYNPSGGGFGVFFPLVQGNLGWIVANDRDISLFLQNYEESNPNTARKHSFSDAVFFPDLMTGYSIDGEDSANMTIQNLDASVKIALSGTKLKFKAPTIDLDATDVNINSTTLKHNGTDIGETHGHSQPNDSNGNTEENTSTPFTV
jgi:hypothetical protein